MKNRNSDFKKSLTDQSINPKELLNCGKYMTAQNELTIEPQENNTGNRIKGKRKRKHSVEKTVTDFPQELQSADKTYVNGKQRKRVKTVQSIVTAESQKGRSRKPEKKERKRRRTKKCTEASAGNDSAKMLTNSNYPKELATTENFSCNWKKLFENINSSKPSSSEAKVIGNAKRKTAGPSEQHQLKSSTNASTNLIWFDGVDRDLLELPEHEDRPGTSRKENSLVRDGSFKGMTKAVAMDCEMVGIGENGQDSILARVSIVNLMGNCIYDKFVKTTDKITDYRTAISGIRPADLEKGEDFKVIQEEVSKILDKRTLVGHAIHNDLKVLFLTHPRRKLRDTSAYKPFRQISRGNTPSLKLLAQKLLGVSVQDGEHSSVQDAQAAMRLYTMHKKDWEFSLRHKKSKRKGASSEKSKMPGTTSPTAAGGKKPTHSPTARRLSKLKI